LSIDARHILGISCEKVHDVRSVPRKVPLCPIIYGVKLRIAQRIYFILEALC